ncbi:hypothetical protein [Halodesulfovibrio aestuarii]|uniref:Uncharacterized protein n=1 Tax=Halodesulfovibrio aestuarii TaxID=126333 RepID=A0ABV4JQ75_9BACT
MKKLHLLLILTVVILGSVHPVVALEFSPMEKELTLADGVTYLIDEANEELIVVHGTEKTIYEGVISGYPIIKYTLVHLGDKALLKASWNNGRGARELGFILETKGTKTYVTRTYAFEFMNYSQKFVYVKLYSRSNEPEEVSKKFKDIAFRTLDFDYLEPAISRAAEGLEIAGSVLIELMILGDVHVYEIISNHEELSMRGGMIAVYKGREVSLNMCSTIEVDGDGEPIGVASLSAFDQRDVYQKEELIKLIEEKGYTATAISNYYVVPYREYKKASK